MISSSASERAETASAATEADASTAAAHEATKGTRGKQYFFSKFPIHILDVTYFLSDQIMEVIRANMAGFSCLMLISYKNLTSGSSNRHMNN